MGLMPAGAANPFTKLDKQSVIGTLKAWVIGAFFTVTVVLAIAGIPAVLFGWWCWRFGSKNVAAVEAGYSEYVGALA